MKKALVIGLVVITTMSLIGCSKDPLAKLSKKELIDTVNTQSDNIDTKATRIEELETLLKGIQEQDAPTASISTMDDGTGRLTFNSINGKIVFPAPFEYPESTESANTSSVSLTDKISLVPTSNWIVKMNGTSIEFNHTNGVNGIIKAGEIKDTYDRDKLQEEVMSQFFADFPPDKITYSKLFLEDQSWGVDAKTATTIDGKPAYLRCGMLGFSGVCFTYMFVYDGDQDVTKDEVILSLLKTTKVIGQQLRIG